MGIGKSMNRVDAFEKVTGRAKYTADLVPPGCLTAKVVHSTIANGRVKAFDLEEALAVKGVIKIVTCFDVPDIPYPTPGHPWSVELAHQDIADRRLLNERVRIYGDDIAAVVAQDELAAAEAVRLIRVEYETYPPALSPEEAMKQCERPLHAGNPDNVLAESGFSLGDVSYEEAASEKGLLHLEKTYSVQTVKHCHLEPPVSWAKMENGRVVVMSSTQIPHIVRRVIGQALGMPWGKFRVIKPYIGGGFGNKQEVLYEPLNAFLCLAVGGRPVKIELTREESFFCTRVRHAMDFHTRAAFRGDGRLVARELELDSNQGGYASHGHAVAANAANLYKQLYQDEKALEVKVRTVYTNRSTGGAMRGYGIPQADFAAEAQADDIARIVGMDPLEYRLMNGMPEDYVDPHTGVACHSYGLRECIERGRAAVGWDEKRSAYARQSGSLRRGVGMAVFCYKTGIYPISLETASCRMILNQDGSMQVQMGATEIGQGADTVFTQMAAEVTGITEDRIYIQSFQDTDITPFDTGAYASRQTYVSGMALKQTGQKFKEKILEAAAAIIGMSAQELDILENKIVEKDSGSVKASVGQVAENAFYSRDRSVHITAESTWHCRDNTFATGACFAEVEVDMPLGKVKILKLVNVHDSGTLINPKLAEAQVHGGMSMGLGYGLSEELLYDAMGRPLNNNFLDYKLPTAMDTPDLTVDFVELVDPTGPFGNKALGEPPAIPTAPAVRNAVLHATGVAIDSLPLSPEKLVTAFQKAGLI